MALLCQVPLGAGVVLLSAAIPGLGTSLASMTAGSILLMWESKLSTWCLYWSTGANLEMSPTILDLAMENLMWPLWTRSWALLIMYCPWFTENTLY